MIQNTSRPSPPLALVAALAVACGYVRADGEKHPPSDKPVKASGATLPPEDRQDLLQLVRRYNAARGDAAAAEAVVRRAVEIGELGVKRLGPAVEKDYQEKRRKYQEQFAQEVSAARDKIEAKAEDKENGADGDPEIDALSQFLADRKPLAELREQAVRAEKLMKLLLDAAGAGEVDREARARFAALAVARFESATWQQVLDEAELAEFDPEEAAVVTATNRERAAKGLPPLIIDKALGLAAADHSADMQQEGFFDHESPIEGKRTPADRAKNFGTMAAGENIAQARSGEAAVEMWMDSDGHRRNILDPYYRRIGVGRSGKYFTQMFGR